MSSGKSKSKENRLGIRRNIKGKDLLPRSLRCKGTFIDNYANQKEINSVLENINERK